MIGPVFAPIHVASQQLHILSHQFRLYVGLSRDGSYLHVVAPTEVELRDDGGELVRPAGTLVCATCKGFAFKGHCYRTAQAEAYERGDAIEEAWFGHPAPASEAEVRHERLTYGPDNPAGAGDLVEASRG